MTGVLVASLTFFCPLLIPPSLTCYVCLLYFLWTWCARPLCLFRTWCVYSWPAWLSRQPLNLLNSLFMDNRVWNILCWNIHGINASTKWDAIRNKIEESSCSIICLQETKREHFDISYIRNFAPRHFDNFDYIPFIGASEGLFILWCSSTFTGTII